jgi:hypothetical protein
MDKWFRKTYVLHNLRHLKNNENVDGDDLITIDKHIDKKYLNYEKAKQTERIEYVKDLIETLGFDLNNVGKDSMISRDEFDINKINCFEICKIFTDIEHAEPLFGVKICNLQTNKAFMGFVNTILQHYGLCIKLTQSSIWDKNAKKKVNRYNYFLDYYENINNYM